MGTTVVTLLFLSLIAIVVSILVCVMLYNRTKRQAQNAADEIRRKAEEAEEAEECRGEKQVWRNTRDNAQQQVELEHHQPEDDHGETRKEHQKVETEYKHLQEDALHKAGQESKHLEPSKRGGAGLVARLEKKEMFRDCLEAAQKRVSGNCGCSEETSCYGCLRTYRNQFAHKYLQRGPVRHYLDKVLSEWK